MMCVIFCVNMTGCGETKESTIKPGSSILVPPKKSIKEAPTNKNSDELTITGVLSYNDKTEKKAHFVDISSNVEYEVPYSGGTDIQSKYGTVISAGSMQLGAIYDVVCYKSGIAKSIYGNKNEWEKKSVNDIEVDESSKKIVVGASNLKYDEKIVILSGDDRVAIASIIKQDEVTIRGIDNTAYSIIVNVDHGYIRFTGVSAFIGGYVTIGRDNMYTVTEDMLVASKVGTQQIEIQSGNTKSTKAAGAGITEKEPEAKARAVQRTEDESGFTPMTVREVEIVMPDQEASGGSTEAEERAENAEERAKPVRASSRPKEETVPFGVDSREGTSFSSSEAGNDSEKNNNDRILQLHKAGKSNMAIARELGLGIGEVKLVIDLFEGA